MDDEHDDWGPLPEMNPRVTSYSYITAHLNNYSTTPNIWIDDWRPSPLSKHRYCMDYWKSQGRPAWQDAEIQDDQEIIEIDPETESKRRSEENRSAMVRRELFDPDVQRQKKEAWARTRKWQEHDKPKPVSIFKRSEPAKPKEQQKEQPEAQPDEIKEILGPVEPNRAKTIYYRTIEEAYNAMIKSIINSRR